MNFEAVIRQTIDFIEENLHEPLTLDEVSERVGFSKFYFHRIFRSALGMSVAEYIRMRRLANASAALLYTSERIIDIAFYYQFKSQEAFTRAFKQHYHYVDIGVFSFIRTYSKRKVRYIKHLKKRNRIIKCSGYNRECY